MQIGFKRGEGITIYKIQTFQGDEARLNYLIEKPAARSYGGRENP
jgi:hypothetical protein